MKWHEHCQYMELPREYPVTELARFHGHLGPFIVLGYRMGRYALQRLGVIHLRYGPVSIAQGPRLSHALLTESSWEADALLGRAILRL
jgi:hypothetical protein